MIHPDPLKCPHCGNFHATTCHRIKAIEYHPDGTIKRLEFMAPRDYGPALVGGSALLAKHGAPPDAC